MSRPALRRKSDARLRQIISTRRRPLTPSIFGLTLEHRQTTQSLFQETMLRAWRNLDTLPTDDEAGRRWLHTAASRVAIDDIRSRRPPAEVDPPDAEGLATVDVTAPRHWRTTCARPSRT